MVFTTLFKVYMPQIRQVTMARFRSGNFLRPINRIKHVVDLQFATAAGAAQGQNLIIASDTPDLATSNEVQTGATVNAIYLKLEANITSSGALANAYMIVFKSPGGNLTQPTPNAVGISDDKRYVIHQEMIMFQQQTGSNPRTVFNGVIKIPRGYKRFGPNDVLILRVLAPGVATNWCFQCHYKEFR